MNNYTKPWIISLNKPSGITSHDVIRDLKKLLPKPFGKIGHFGTLDPFAEGLLLIGGNGGQKLNEYIHSWFPKTYEAIGILGQATVTGDMTEEGMDQVQICGDTKAQEEIQMMDLQKIQDLWVQKYLGEYLQVPPMYSAAKHEGKPLHYYARQGIKIEKEPVARKVLEIKVLEINFPKVHFKVTVSSGTYIRKLFEDMAMTIGTLGVLKELKRTEIGPFSLKDAVDLSKLSSWSWDNQKPIEEIVPIGSVILNERGSYLYGHGQSIEMHYVDKNQTAQVETPESADFVWVKSANVEVLGLARAENQRLRPQFNFPNQ